MIFIEDILAQVGVAEKLGAAVKSKLPASMLIQSLPRVEQNDTAVILFTSGSEKEPKGVQLSHKNLASNIRDLTQVFHLTSDDVMMSILPLFHVFGHNANFWLPLLAGMTIVSYANPLDYKKIPSIIREEKPTLMAATPIFFAGYLRESKPGDLASIRMAMPGADKTPEWLREGYREKHGIELLEAYGATETSPGVSVNTHEANRPGSIGRPLPSVQVRIEDITTGHALPVGQEGKIMVKGDLVMKGYFDDLEETSLRIRNGWYDTGDMGMMDEDGFLWHRGRLKRFVKIGGEMVSLVRTEMVLEELLPSGVACCVVEVPDSIKGARIVAVVTDKVADKELMRKMSHKLPAIAIPKIFMVLPELPKMGSGKIDFRSVAQMVKANLEKR
ncbi:MAG: bifunctional acyl-ACP--phospholipid O-acyltransferase/long-chain-fatty-acid--ACP ligase [Calditrichaeota bacterium]|nr:MAG: bifunctional acyl-ACP--phospholipid O-acyltransferase/long-chain-fatty-acid--ACP ligase [Calditrichota bacterium]